jgi:hypothetical protein
MWVPISSIWNVINREGYFATEILITGAALAFPLGAGIIVATTTTPAGAAVPVITANGSATCSTLKGAIHFNPPLFNTGTSNSETASIKVKLNSSSGGCSTTATNLPAGGILYGIASSSLTTTSTDNSANACAGLGTSQATTQTITWHYKSSAGVTLAKLTPTTVTFSGFDVLTNALVEPGFDLPQDTGGTTTATGSFAGTGSQANIFATKTITFITGKCGTSTGMTALPLGGAGTATDPSQSITG